MARYPLLPRVIRWVGVDLSWQVDNSCELHKCELAAQQPLWVGYLELDRERSGARVYVRSDAMTVDT